MALGQNTLTNGSVAETSSYWHDAVGPSPTLVYDGHGNTTVLADQTLTYDVADRHVGTALADGTTVEYERDTTGRIVARTDDAPLSQFDGLMRSLAKWG